MSRRVRAVAVRPSTASPPWWATRVLWISRQDTGVPRRQGWHQVRAPTLVGAVLVSRS